MPVIHFRFADRGIARRLADYLDDDPELKNAAREIRRVLIPENRDGYRPGRGVELGCEEMIAIAALADRMTPQLAALVVPLGEEAERRMERDRHRRNPGREIRNRRRAMGLYSE